MVLLLKQWKSRASPGITVCENTKTHSLVLAPIPSVAGWSSPVARQAHNLKAAGSNPAPATNSTTTKPSQDLPRRLFCACFLRLRPESRTLRTLHIRPGGARTSICLWGYLRGYHPGLGMRYPHGPQRAPNPLRAFKPMYMHGADDCALHRSEWPFPWQRPCRTMPAVGTAAPE